MKFRLRKLNGERVDADADIAGEELVDRERLLGSLFRKYASQGEASVEELHEIERNVYERGYVLLWSAVLEDCIAFYNLEGDLEHVPPGFVSYSIEELWHLFGNEEDILSRNVLRRIHEAKKTGAEVTGVKEDQS